VLNVRVKLVEVEREALELPAGEDDLDVTDDVEEVGD
jgi:hypothetical protein